MTGSGFILLSGVLSMDAKESAVEKEGERSKNASPPPGDSPDDAAPREQAPAAAKDRPESALTQEEKEEIRQAIDVINRLIVAERDRSRLLRSVCDLFVDERGYLSAWIALFDACEGLTTFASSGGETESIPAITLLRDGFLPPCAAEVLAELGGTRIDS